MATYKADWGKGYSVEFRDLTWKEYQDLCMGVDPEDLPPDVALALYETCVTSGPDIRLVTAGIAYFVARQQLRNNPFSGEPKALANTLGAARNYVQSSYLLAAQGLIAYTFNVSIDEIKNWTAEKFFIRLAQAEVVTNRNFNPIAPEEVPAPKPKASARELVEKRHSEKNTRIR